MPFVPLDSDEVIKEPCRDPEHNPPSHVVLAQDSKWVCPGCGRSIIIRIPRIHWTLKAYENKDSGLVVRMVA